LLRASSDRLCLKIDPADDQFCKEREWLNSNAWGYNPTNVSMTIGMIPPNWIWAHLEWTALKDAVD
jgi:hypothetical protein